MFLPFRFSIALFAASAGSLTGLSAAETAAASPSAPTAAPAAVPAASGSTEPIQVASPVLRQILLTDDLEAAPNLSPQPEAGFLVASAKLAFLNLAELNKFLVSGKGMVIDDRLLAGIAHVVQTFVRSTENPLATVVIPPQNIREGAVRVAVVLGKIRQITFKGNRWSSDSLLREKLSVQKGEIIRLTQLDRALAVTNNNPYRRVKAHIDPIPDSTDANLIIGVQERLPLRLTASFDDGGNAVIGKHRFFGGFNYAGLWGRDHQLAYQYITSDKSSIFRGHIFDYRAPLHRNHLVSLTASYTHARPQFYDGLFVQDGENFAAELRYTLPVRTGDRPIDAFAAVAFKQSNNNLEYGGLQVLTNKADLFHLVTGASTVVRDRKGGWAFSGTLTVSPGNFNSRNRDTVFNGIRGGAVSQYAFATLGVQRLLQLGDGWEILSRATFQRASSNLLSSEQLGAGGASSVRGYPENTFTGDKGFTFGSEVLTPVRGKILPFLKKGSPPAEARLLAFFDAANVSAKRRTIADTRTIGLASAGVGLRASVSTHVSLSADYGWQMISVPGITERSRAHLRLSASY